jgi:hypothetical protein
MKFISQYKKVLVAVLLFVGVVLLCASWYIQNERSEYTLKTEVQIAEQETKLAAISELTDRDGADAVVEAIIKDCSPANRERFDFLLGKLGELRGAELGEIEKLFDACGNFYAERKAVMVARFEREFEVYQDYIEILDTVGNRADVYRDTEEKWSKLVAMEKERSVLSTRLVVIQGMIIEALRDGVLISSDQMQVMLVEGQQVKDTLNTLSKTIDEQRQSVLAL